MADLFDGKLDVILDDKYNSEYELISNIKTTTSEKFKTADIFFLAMIIGYRKHLRLPSDNHNGKEFRPSYFTSLQKNLIYAFVLNLPDFKPEDMVDEKKMMPIYDILREYANGGITWMRENVLNEFLNNNGELHVNSHELTLRLGQMIYDELNPKLAPF